MRFTLILFIFLLTQNIFASPLIINDIHNNKSTDLVSSLKYYIDKNKKYNIREILAGTKDTSLQWMEPEGKRIGFGFTDIVCWLTFTVENKSNNDLTWFLQQEYPLIDSIILYEINENNKIIETITGDNLSFRNRPVQYRNFIFPLKSPSGSKKTFFLRYETTSSMKIELKAITSDYFEELRDMEMRFFWMFYGFLFFLLIYNLFIFISTRDVSYIYYIAYIFFFLIFAMGQNGTAFQYLWPDNPWLANYSIPASLGLLTFACLQFARYFVSVKDIAPTIDKLCLILAVINLTAGILSLLILDYRIAMVSTSVIAFTTICMVVPFLYYLVIKRESRQALFFLISFLFLFIGALLFLLKSFNLIEDNFITIYGLQIGSSLQVVLLSLVLEDKVKNIKNRLVQAEKKFFYLVDDANDIIFSLDENFLFTSLNKSVESHLGFLKNEFTGKHFLEIIYDDDKEKILTNIIIEYLSELKANKKSVTFQASLVKKIGFEPSVFTITLESIEIAGSLEILGKATLSTDDIISQFLDAEKQIFTITNNFSNADLLSHRLGRNLFKFLPRNEIYALRTCLREIIINAIEHGNLNISFEEKTQGLLNSNYLNLISERKKDNRYKSRTVKVEHAFNSNFAAYRITDEGKGFDHKDYMENAIDLAINEMLPHGRGLIMVRDAFDIITFNTAGNSILVIKKFNDYNDENCKPVFIK